MVDRMTAEAVSLERCRAEMRQLDGGALDLEEARLWAKNGEGRL